MVTRHMHQALEGAKRWWAATPLGIRAALGIVFVISVVYGTLETAILSSFGPPARWASTDVFESTEPLQEVLVTLVDTRDEPEDAGSLIDLTGLDSFVIGVDLDALDNLAISYQLSIKDFADEVLWSAEIPEDFLSDGRALVRLKPKRFPEGKYAVEVEAYESDGFTRLVLRGIFDVIK